MKEIIKKLKNENKYNIYNRIILPWGRQRICGPLLHTLSRNPYWQKFNISDFERTQGNEKNEYTSDLIRKLMRKNQKNNSISQQMSQVNY